MPRFGIFCAFTAAILFGASIPLAKSLIDAGTDPFMLAGLFYLGSGLGLGTVRLTGRGIGRSGQPALAAGDWKWMALVVLAGGVAGPILLMVGLQTTPASTSSLLLNLESVATLAIAWVIFHEHFDRRLLAGAAAIVTAGVLLTWHFETFVLQPGALAIVLACVAWGADNNLTRMLSAADPLHVAQIKGLAAGTVNVILALAAGAHIPPPSIIVVACTVGFLGYGISLSLYVLGLRHLGAARTAAYFATAPFIGAIIAVAALHEPISLPLAVAALLMAPGVALHFLEKHVHPHTHEAIEHSHRHVHDEHHRHQHAPGDPAGEPHAHRHVHATITHSHPHYPDIHHRHRHDNT